MKTIFLLALFFQSFAIIASPSSVSNSIILPSIEDKHVQIEVRVTCNLVSYKACDPPPGISATVQVNIHINNPVHPETFLLVATQIVDIPCGTISGMTRPDFDKYARDKKEKYLEKVTDYLDQHDKDGTIFNKVRDQLSETLTGLEKKK